MTVSSICWFLAATMVPGCCVACLVTALMRTLAPRWGLIDRPNHRKVHRTPIPLGGGLGIIAGVVGPFAAGTGLILGLDPSPYLPAFVVPHLDGVRDRLAELWVLLGAGAALGAIGLIDDKRGLNWRVRLLLEFAIAAGCVVTQGWQLTLFIDLPWVGGWLSAVLSTVWIVAMINSFNMLDNMDGLSSGVAAIAAGVLGAVMLTTPDAGDAGPQLFVAGLLYCLVGALLGFLVHNRPPARIFMGDAGAYFVGYYIGVATLLATFAGYSSNAPAPHAVFAPLCVMAVPLYDMATVIWIRLSEGRSPFEADKNHFSHRLVELGMNKDRAVLTIYLTTAACGLGALLLHQVNLAGGVIVMLLIGSILGLIAILESTARRNRRRER